MSDDWKQVHANEAERVFETTFMQDVIDELIGNLGAKDDALVRYGINKVASYAAQVARAQALGFDPELLRLTEAEADKEMLRLARAAVAAGKPVWLISLAEVVPLFGVSRAHMGERP